MKEIGGYLELAGGNQPLYHDGIYLNSGRNALRFIVRKLGIRKLHVPAYTCPVVFDALQKERVKIEQYALDSSFFPDCDFPKNDFIIYNNYFGVCGGKVREMVMRYPNLIVDNAQAFYSRQIGRAAFYSPRKFFGLPDGGIVCGLEGDAEDFPRDVSWNRMTYLLKRVDLGASAGYADFKKNSKVLARQDVKQMSALTTLLMSQLDCKYAAKRRLQNFNILRGCLPTTFPMDTTDDDVPLVYPYAADAASVRPRLIDNKIYVPLYWSEVCNDVVMSEHIVSLPIDQRYGEYEMKRIVEVIKE